ncbi:cadmium-translocating P-type ATPase [Vibrio sp. S4M6]|uniref:heavy metal translocating P-type ATPase n=1 Tax=Vibrio sinus TaxID=2946865 RepID=UPI00202ABA5F|nr:heavy metal translocating P-type ATPase [Vibrio sinus]MCL9783277.1 cadmium-translocating P-type ATPase [Vibrio sinus]
MCHCYHCGEDVPPNSEFHLEVLGENRQMCCPGCLAVAQTIVDTGLVSYYQYRTEPADRAQLIPEELLTLTNYDNPDIQAEFVRESESGQEVTLSLSGISCAACAWLIEKRLSSVNGVLLIRVNTTTNRALVKWNPNKVKLSSILKDIHKLGYKAAPFEPDKQEDEYHRSMKQYLYRLGIAGLATMQVMMLAVALYFEVFSDLDNQFKAYLRWVSLIFATPVLLYSASPFYLNAYRSLKNKTLGMDVPVSLALLFAYGASAYATVTEQGEVFFESISMFTFFLLLGRFLEIRARRTAAAASGNLLKLVPAMATTLDGHKIPVSRLNIGDKIRVLPGERIPADGEITSGQAYIDESMLTGESVPVLKVSGDNAFSGTLNGEESFELCVRSTKANSVISGIVKLQEEAQLSKPKIAEIADITARYFVGILLVVAGLTWLYWHQHKPEDAFWIMLAVLVATCPCALSLATPTALTCATSKLSQLGILLRRKHVFETLYKVNHLIIDKTGTLTQGKVELNEIMLFGGYNEELCLSIAEALESHANHPIANAFKGKSRKNVSIEQVKNHIGEGVLGLYQGKVIKIGSAAFALNDKQRDEINSVYLSLDHKHIATFIFHDPLRKEAKSLVDKFASSNIKITLLTGDTLSNARHVSNAVGIKNVVASASPQGKLAFLKQLPEQDITLMIGDGINDAPTLSGAHLSAAMGGGTDIAKASADMTLLSDKLEKIVQARDYAIRARQIIRQNLLWSLGYNLLVLPLAVCGLIAPYFAVIGMSASSIIVVSNSLRLLKD